MRSGRGGGLEHRRLLSVWHVCLLQGQSRPTPCLQIKDFPFSPSVLLRCFYQIMFLRIWWVNREEAAVPGCEFPLRQESSWNGSVPVGEPAWHELLGARKTNNWTLAWRISFRTFPSVVFGHLLRWVYLQAASSVAALVAFERIGGKHMGLIHQCFTGIAKIKVTHCWIYDWLEIK